MNINFILKCETCETHTAVRAGMSNRASQPLHFSCQTCGSPIGIASAGGCDQIANEYGEYD
ncbi:hypothetical protein GGQ85_000880 [Nitrobacter vulgaris]|nr:hypothetical protein [Nitrobacter vulgaris]